MKPYQDKRDKAEQVNEMFDRIAARYDFLNRLMSLGIDRSWRRKMVSQVRDSDPSDILDLATGTGDLALMLSQAMPSARITGADPSSGMLSVAREKIARTGKDDSFALVTCSAEELPFSEGSFDAVTIAFGIRNFTDRGKSLDEIYRVLRPGGRIFVLEFSVPQGRIFGSLYRFYSRRLMPVIGGVVSGDRKAYTYLPLSIEEFPDGEKFTAIMNSSGFRSSIKGNYTGGIAKLYIGIKQ